uniref:Vipericidin n=1 Tax=Anolis carolinensis TaxID=28377 RepID=A0A803T8V5_ANOCA
MERCWVSLLLLGSVSANVFLRDTPPLSYNKAQVAVVKQFNIEATPPNLYRLVSADPVPKWNPTSSDFQSFPLKIKETVCHGDPEKIKVDKCAFKANGVRSGTSSHGSRSLPPSAPSLPWPDPRETPAALLLFHPLLFLLPLLFPGTVAGQGPPSPPPATSGRSLLLLALALALTLFSRTGSAQDLGSEDGPPQMFPAGSGHRAAKSAMDLDLSDALDERNDWGGGSPPKVNSGGGGAKGGGREGTHISDADLAAMLQDGSYRPDRKTALHGRQPFP